MRSSSRSSRLAACLVLGLVAVASVLGFNLNLNPNTGLPKKWPAGPIPFRIMLGETKSLSDGTSFNTSAQAAAEAWNAVIGSVQFQVTLAPPGAATQDNGVNEMVFAPTAFGQTFPAGVVGVTAASGTGNMVAETDIILNSSPTYTWDSYRGAPRAMVEIRRVVLHELGHSLGLEHSATGVGSIMTIQSNNYESVQPDDISGVQSLYGPPHTSPGNDDFANSSPLTLINNSRLIDSFNTNATKEPGEPNHAVNSGSSQTPNVGGRSVWWRWTAPAAGSVTISTKGSYFDTTLGVYTGSAVASLTPVASSDDIQAGVIQASLVSFNVTAGTIYRIAVDGFNGDDGHGADSGRLMLNVAYDSTGLIAPGVSAQPTGATVNFGGSVSFSVGATGSAPLSYQWLFNGSALAGATSATYSIASATAAQGGTYSVIVSNSAGSVTSEGATLIVNAPLPTPAPTPSSGGGGGGGAPSLWFAAWLAMLGVARLRSMARRTKP